MMVLMAIHEVTLILLYVVVFIATYKEKKHLDEGDPNSPIIEHLLDIKIWLAALVAVVALR